MVMAKPLPVFGWLDAGSLKGMPESHATDITPKSILNLVEVRRVELLTFSLRTRRSTN
jgi:hypothetical protein